MKIERIGQLKEGRRFWLAIMRYEEDRTTIEFLHDHMTFVNVVGGLLLFRKETGKDFYMQYNPNNGEMYPNIWLVFTDKKEAISEALRLLEK